MIVRRCDNNFCIYWEDFRCTLDEISLDAQGRCEALIQVSFDEADLQKIREQQLLKLSKSE